MKLLFALSTVVFGFAALAGTTANAGRAGDPVPPLPHGTQTHQYDSPLLNVTTLEQQGAPDAAGNCTFAPLGELRLSVGTPSAVQRRQTAMDYDSCTRTYEVGTPARFPTDEEPAIGTSRTLRSSDLVDSGNTQARKSKRSSPSRTFASWYPVRGYYELGWEDYIGIDLSHTSPHIQTTSGGTCVWLTGTGTYAYWWWNSDLGWHLLDSDASESTSRYGACTGEKGWYWSKHERASPYWDTVFCGYEVDVWVQNANVTASPAALSGANDATWHTQTCAPLYSWENLVVT